MKELMQQFHDRTTQRFHEYDERMQSKRMQCKERCDKEIQKIILKDKLEKELMDKFATLQTDIQSDSIPTCVCEKSLADKVEKGCLRCGYGLGTVAPTVGLIGSVAVHVWKPVAIKAAIAAALKANGAMISDAAKAAGIEAGINAVMSGLNSEFGLSTQAVQKIGLVFDGTNYTNVSNITTAIFTKYKGSCFPSAHVPVTGTSEPICRKMIGKAIFGGRGSEEAAIESTIKTMVSDAEATAQMTTETTTKEAISTLTIEKTGEVNATYASCQTAIIASIVAILLIVLVMVIIYLILRYRRKKKMKKKLQYIKLLKE
ncbi:hypothetical protein PFMALIP_05713 [Plasmodium falciparum MaliPS096_E11]|uniref:Surface antigen n=1 Tax=Plasmodium falciparum MaliPS096_E11 TaxID=1036727 RepID=A0A024WGC1_PLAFA|nr:hypothetical protein PFMALIP_05713 [Plasmodium falciparum MaliPS096_E11]